MPRFARLLLRGTQKCSENGRDKQEKSELKRSNGKIRDKKALQATSSDCQRLHTFSLREKGTGVFIGKRATSIYIRVTSTHLGKVGEIGTVLLYICLRLPFVSLDFIEAWNEDFACVHLHQTK